MGMHHKLGLPGRAGGGDENDNVVGVHTGRRVQRAATCDDVGESDKPAQ